MGGVPQLSLGLRITHAQVPTAYPHLLRHLPLHMHRRLYHAILVIWRGNKICPTWFASMVVLIYKKKDPEDQKNYRPMHVSTAINGILTRLLPGRITKAITPGVPNSSSTEGGVASNR